MAKLKYNFFDNTVSYEMPTEVYQLMQVSEETRQAQEQTGIITIIDLAVTCITFPAPLAEAFTKAGFKNLSDIIDTNPPISLFFWHEIMPSRVQES
jgi:hypothetical protein